MAKGTKVTIDKKALQKEVTYQLENALGKLKDLLGEKKFNARVNKAVKLLTDGMKKGGKKKATETENATPVKKKGADTKRIATDKKAPAAVPVKKRAAAKKPATVKQGDSDSGKVS